MIARVLPPEDWSLLDEAHPAQIAQALPNGAAAVVVVEDGGKIVGTLTVAQITHLEGLWIAPEFRGNPRLSMALVEAAFAEVRKTGALWAWGASDTEHMSDIIGRVGGKEIPVKSFIIPVGGTNA